MKSTAITSGVAPGDLVVVDGADKLREGAKVELITRDAQGAPAPARPKRGPRGDRPPGNGPARWRTRRRRASQATAPPQEAPPAAAKSGGG